MQVAAEPRFHVGDVFDTSKDDDWWGPTRRVTAIRRYLPDPAILYDFVILDGPRAGRSSSCSERQIIIELRDNIWVQIDQYPSHIRLPRGV